MQFEGGPIMMWDEYIAQRFWETLNKVSNSLNLRGIVIHIMCFKVKPLTSKRRFGLQKGSKIENFWTTFLIFSRFGFFIPPLRDSGPPRGPDRQGYPVYLITFRLCNFRHSSSHWLIPLPVICLNS